MDFDSIVDILFDGEKKDMEAILCPECGGTIKYEIGQENQSMRVVCTNCGSGVRMGKLAEIPNCKQLFGDTHEFQKNAYISDVASF